MASARMGEIRKGAHCDKRCAPTMLSLVLPAVPSSNMGAVEFYCGLLKDINIVAISKLFSFCYRVMTGYIT